MKSKTFRSTQAVRIGQAIKIKKTRNQGHPASQLQDWHTRRQKEASEHSKYSSSDARTRAGGD